MSLKLEVAEARPGDAGQKKALVDPEVMGSEGIEKGDVVKTKG